MKHLIIFFSIFTLLAFNSWGQLSGNQVIGHYSYNNYDNAFNSQSINKLYLNDSSFIIQANVIANVIADNYVATFGVSESAKTLKEANSKIDERIQKFIAVLTKINIPQSDIYVDMTTQTLISDYQVKENYAEQFISGFEQKKNVIVKFKNIKLLDKMLLIASEFEIYDLTKVDYIVSDVNKIYMQLYQTAVDVIQGKKDLYVKATNMNLKSTSEIYGEFFNSYNPTQLYKSYSPNISAEYFDYSSNGRKKDLKSNTTFYYDHLNYSGFDKVINPIITEPAVEFVFLLQIKFDINKNAK